MESTSSSLKETFTELRDEYAFLEVMKYLPFKNRIRFERVNKRWAELLASHWKRQVVLGFNDTTITDDCLKREHHLTRFDYFMETKPLAQKAIISRCINLKAIDLSLTQEYDEMPFDLMKSCPNLEHICFHVEGKANSSPRSFMHLFPFIFKFKLTCLMVAYQDRSTEVPQHFLQCFPSLEHLVIPQMVDYNLLPLLKCFSSSSEAQLRSLFDFNEKANIRTMYLRNVTLKQPLDLTCFPNLATLHIEKNESICTSWLNKIKLPPTVVSLDIFWRENYPLDFTDIVAFIRKMGLNLNSLFLSGPFSGSLTVAQILTDVQNVAPNIRDLGLRLHIDTFGKLDTNNCRFHRLRDLYLSITDTDVASILESCPKLRVLDVKDARGYSIDVLLDVQAFASKHPKRLVSLIVHPNLFKRNRIRGPIIRQNLRIRCEP